MAARPEFAVSPGSGSDPASYLFKMNVLQFLRGVSPQVCWIKSLGSPREVPTPGLWSMVREPVSD